MAGGNIVGVWCACNILWPAGAQGLAVMLHHRPACNGTTVTQYGQCLFADDCCCWRLFFVLCFA
jgi:hypothetical protein